MKTLCSHTPRTDILSKQDRLKLAQQHYDRRSQFQLNQIRWIIDQCEDRFNGKCLFFGSGYDSPMWARISDATFLEDNPKFYRKLFDSLENQFIKAWLVNYQTLIETWQQDILNQTLNTLPQEVERTRYDVIVIDGPRGNRPKSPGRVTPAFHAKQLIKPGGMVVMDDLHRKIDFAIAQQVFGEPTAVQHGRSTIGCWEIK